MSARRWSPSRPTGCATLCTPLVIFPTDGLRDGQHLKGRTVAEFGSGVQQLDNFNDESPLALQRMPSGKLDLLLRLDAPARRRVLSVFVASEVLVPSMLGDVDRRVSLLDGDGRIVEQAFVETVPELWDRERRRLTLILHPGRIKRGLEMRERNGPALRSGERYRLRVDAGMRDASGRSLAGEFEHGFWVDETDGSSWRYVPERPWQAGRLSLLVHPSVEDLAGNRLDRLFDVEPESASGITSLEPVRIGLEIGR